MQARYYDPAIGRFMGIDPVGVRLDNQVSFNRYAYGNNNPYKYIDPNGEFAIFGLLATPQGIALTGLVLAALAQAISETNALLSEGVDEGVSPPSDDVGESDHPNLVDDDRAAHILDGDETGGGHRPGTGAPGKSEFPQDWSDDKILGAISDVATNPESSRRKGRRGRTIASGTVDGVDIDVVIGNKDEDGKIISGYPTNLGRNPSSNSDNSTHDSTNDQR